MLAVALVVFFISFKIMGSPKWRSHSGVYNEDDGVKPPVETFDDVGIPTPKYGRNAFVEFEVMGDEPKTNEDKKIEK